MKNMFDVNQEFVYVLAGDNQASLLRLVQRP
jgi:hypothetical protein